MAPWQDGCTDSSGRRCERETSRKNMIREAQIALPSHWGRGIRRVSLVLLMLAASLSLASQGSDRQHGAAKNRVSPELARLSDAVQHGNIKNQTIQVIV